jgi:peptidoglycan/LPS O-acetylase OafA/YrhL
MAGHQRLRQLIIYMAAMNTPHSTPRIYGLDTLRAVAIVLVFMNHYSAYISNASVFGIFGEIGWIGVDLFFALSGYLISNQIFGALRSGQPLSLKRFYARRLLRTLPNYYFVLALYFLWPTFRGDGGMEPLWRYLTFTLNLGLELGALFSQAWSLCVEEQFYLVLPALALCIATCRRPLRWAWGTIIACVLGGMLLRATIWSDYGDQSQFVPFLYYKHIYFSTLCRLDELVAGVALALLKNYHGGLWARLTRHGNVVLVAGLLGSAVAGYLFYWQFYGFGMTVAGHPLVALSFGLLLLAALSPNSLLYKTRVPGAASLAVWSYAIYLLHKQLFVLLKPQLVALGVDTNGPLATLLAVLVVCAAGWLMYTLVETPFMKLRQRYVPSNFAPQPPETARPVPAGAIR